MGLPSEFDEPTEFFLLFTAKRSCSSTEEGKFLFQTFAISAFGFQIIIHVTKVIFCHNNFSEMESALHGTILSRKFNLVSEAGSEFRAAGSSAMFAQSQPAEVAPHRAGNVIGHRQLLNWFIRCG